MLLFLQCLLFICLLDYGMVLIGNMLYMEYGMVYLP